MAIKLSSNNGNIQLTSAGGKIIRGIDGGYYTPAIDAEGNLTWIASLKDMSDVPATNIKGPKGDPGATGKDGEPGAKGDTGAAFTYDMFTKEQLASLKGEKGDKGDTGAKGDPFTYNDFTSEQLAALKGEKGDKGDTGATGPQGNPGTTDYNELENKPIIPTVPTNVSAFTNDAGYLISVPAEYVTETELESKGYLTEHQSISGKEDNSNKVTSLSASSTDTQYPSAKCVYDAIGDVETILNTLNDGGGAQ